MWFMVLSAVGVVVHVEVLSVTVDSSIISDSLGVSAVSNTPVVTASPV